MGTNQEESHESKPVFRISAAVVKQLGEELVSDEVTALMELVKNSYDADSKYIKIDINTTDFYQQDDSLFKDKIISKGFVKITDNGFGMSYNEVFNNWLTISMSGKRSAKKRGETTEEGRTFLGEKGVGRLSTQRIGDKIDLVTKSKVTQEMTHIAFDWKNFTEDVTLDSIEIIETHTILSDPEQGTEILIQDLKNPLVWEGELFDKIKGQLSQLISPSSHEGFKVHLIHNGIPINLQDLNTEIRDLAISSFIFDIKEDVVTINGAVSSRKLLGNKKADQEYYTRIIEPDNGKNFFDFLTNSELNKAEYLPDIEYSGDRGMLFTFKETISIPHIQKISWVIDEREFPSSPTKESSPELGNATDNQEEVKLRIAHPGNLNGAIYEFRLDKFLVTDVLNNEGSLKEIIKNQAGIRIFRDGFGIKPYGLEGNDWLRLGSSSTSGGSIYSLRPKNVVGYVSLTAKDNANLKEKTDREGFMESPYTQNFFLIMQEIKESVNLVLEKTRRSFLKYKEFIGKENTGIQNISESFSALTEATVKAKDIKEQTEKLIVRYSRIADKIKVTEKENPNQAKGNTHYSEIIEEIKVILDESREMFGKINSLVSSTENLDQFATYLEPLIESLENQLIEFTSLASLGITAEALSHELSNIVDKLADETSRVIAKSKNKIPKELEYIKTYHERVNTSIIAFRKQLSHLDPSLKYTREKKEIISLNHLVEELKVYYDEKFRGQIEIEVKNSNQEFNVYGNKGKLFQIFDNFFLNSEYWLKEKSKHDKKFKPKIVIHIEFPLVKFWDNGTGIDPAVENTLFQPFVTKKSNNTGRGLGLFIVLQLLDSMGCTISLLPNRNEDSRRYIFQINLNPIIKR